MKKLFAATLVLFTFACPIFAQEEEEAHSDVEFSYVDGAIEVCLLYTSPSPRDLSTSRMPSSA